MPSSTLQEIYRHCVSHLDSAHRNPNLQITFDYDGYKTWFCSSPIPPSIIPEFPEPLNEFINIFVATGRVSTIRPCEGPDSSGRSIFWVEVEGRNNLISRTLWGQIPESLIAISKAAGLAFAYDKIFEIDVEAGILRLRLTSTSSVNVSSIQTNIEKWKTYLSIIETCSDY